jgi:Icc-related predicted phosphoesterase
VILGSVSIETRRFDGSREFAARKPPMSPPYKLFYASDIHGSEKCFLKFVNAGKFYKANALVLGGDITGKMVVPLIERTGRWQARFLGREFTAETPAERAEIEKNIRMNGFYPIVLSPEEHAHFQTNETERAAMIERVVADSIRRWIGIAEERLRGTGIRCFMNAGNDDDEEVDAALRQSDVVENHDGGVTDLTDEVQMAICGYSNTTPFDSPREMAEPVLESHIETIVAKLKSPRNAIFTLHVPPVNTGIDSAPQLREGKVVTEAGHTLMAPAGSAAVRNVIERHHPMLALHGHIHESRGTKQLGRTLCINPGSEYSEGVLRGVLVTFKGTKLIGHQLVQA